MSDNYYNMDDQQFNMGSSSSSNGGMNRNDSRLDQFSFDNSFMLPFNQNLNRNQTGDHYNPSTAQVMMGDDDDDDNDSQGDNEDNEPGTELKSSNQVTKAKNREHAKNTRIRKKNYIEALKDTILKLQEEQTKTDRDRKVSLSRLADQALVRKKVLQTMFYFRATAEMNAERWSTILEDSFTLVMPITPYRSFPPSEVFDGQRYIKGIPGVILDSASLNVMLQSICLPPDDGGKVMVQYYSGPDESIMSKDTFMCKWQMFTTNAVSRGCKYEVTKQGMIKANFSPQNKLLFLEQTFDVMSFMQQLRRASGKYDFLVVPNTPFLAEEHVEEARVVTKCHPPFTITFVNQSWANLFGYKPEQVIGKSFSIIFGEDTEEDVKQELIENMEKMLPTSTVITSYSSRKQKFRNWIRCYPLYSEKNVTHLLTVMHTITNRFPPEPRPEFQNCDIPNKLEKQEISLDQEQLLISSNLKSNNNGNKKKNRENSGVTIDANGQIVMAGSGDTDSVQSSSAGSGGNPPSISSVSGSMGSSNNQNNNGNNSGNNSGNENKISNGGRGVHNNNMKIDNNQKESDNCDNDMNQGGQRSKSGTGTTSGDVDSGNSGNNNILDSGICVDDLSFFTNSNLFKTGNSNGGSSGEEQGQNENGQFLSHTPPNDEAQPNRKKKKDNENGGEGQGNGYSDGDDSFDENLLSY